MSEQLCAPMAISETEKIACGFNIVARGLSSALARAVEGHNLSAMEASLLLKMDIGMDSPSKIASCMGIDASNLSRLIRKLEEKEFATREVDDSNRSRAIIKLTAKGQREATAIRPKIRQMEETIMSALTESELKNLKHVLQKLCETLNSV